MIKLFSKSKQRQRPAVSLFKQTARTSVMRHPDSAHYFLPIDKKIAVITFVFICFGLVFTYSSSAFDSSSYFQRQLMFDFVGVAAAIFLSQTYSKLQAKIKPIWLMYITWGFLIWVLFTKPIANVHRWINLGPFNLQPSEIAKVTLVIYMADYLSRVQGKIARNWKLLINPAVIIGITRALMFKAPDLGTPILICGVVAMMLYVAGMSWRQIFSVAPVVLAIVAWQLIFYRYRMERVLSFLHPEKQAATAGYQLTQSFLAVGSGGWFGKGFGNSELKLQYLPAAHTDFIFSIMCEEIGLFGVGIIIFLFCCLLIRGVNLARAAKNGFHSLMIFGLTLTICAQAFFNIAMAIGLLPTKGIPLPFFSYGGSSVIMTLAMIGIICNLSAESTAPKNRPTDDFAYYKNRKKYE
ncbi:MAG: cell division protein FtsW [Elusimicrobiaceae bacterium]|nr:cell division protein FtsW [Elusimicrobiaceae bacterium]